MPVFSIRGTFSIRRKGLYVYNRIYIMEAFIVFIVFIVFQSDGCDMHMSLTH